MLEWSDPDRRDDALLRILTRVYEQPEERSTLTPGELRAIEAMSHGLGEIGAAEVIGVRPLTLKKQLKRARRVLRAKNTTHACCEALRRGLIR